MRTKVRRLLSAWLTLALVLGLVPGEGLRHAMAEATPGEDLVAVEPDEESEAPKARDEEEPDAALEEVTDVESDGNDRVAVAKGEGEPEVATEGKPDVTTEEEPNVAPEEEPNVAPEEAQAEEKQAEEEPLAKEQAVSVSYKAASWERRWRGR